MVRYLLITLSFLLFGSIGAAAQGTLQGKVTEKESGLGAIGATVLVKRGGVQITGGVTDFDGNYSIPNLDPGTYDVEVTYVGFASKRTEGVVIYVNRIVKLDVSLSPDSEVLTEFEVVGYKVPLIEVDNTTGGKTVTAEEIANLPGKSIGNIISTVAGVASVDGSVNVKGSRSNATDYYVDGIRVSGSLPPQSEYEQIQVLTGGISAQYGDVTGGIISIITKGPQKNYSGSLDVETTSLFDNYNYNLAAASIAGPIIKKNDRSILGFRISGQYRYEDDNNPPQGVYYKAKDNVIADIEANPVDYVGGVLRPTANFMTDEDVEAMDFNPNSEIEDMFYTAKLDWQISKAVDVTASGSFRKNKNRFLPGSNDAGNSRWILFNSHNNPYTDFQNYRANFRLRHRLGQSDYTSAGEEGNQSVVQNITYILQGGFERSNSFTYDSRHEDRLFDYGYVGQFDYTFDNAIGLPFDREDPTTYPYFLEHRGFSQTLTGYTPGGLNPVLENYNADIPEGSIESAYLIRNGFQSNTLTEIFNGLHTNAGAVYNNYSKSESDRITAQANVSLEIVPKKNTSNRHNIKFGAMYEQRVSRRWQMNPVRLWQIAEQQVNRNIIGVDTSMIVGDTIIEQTGELIPIYDKATVDLLGNSFYRKVREAFGIPLNEFVNVHGISPDQLSIDMFSSSELTTEGILDYYGYTYDGQKKNTTFDDFFTNTDEDGLRTFDVPAFTPNYFGFYVEDKFNIDDIYFSFGLRMDRYDANTKVAKDLYVLEDVYSAADYHAQFGGSAPSTVGDDAKVYVTNLEQPQVVAYRNGDAWFTSGGTESTGPQIFGGQTVQPMYVNPDVNINSVDFDPSSSFVDYVPQVNFSPRLAFSFAISDVANFYAHYDVMVQRPASNSLFTPLDYYLFYEGGTVKNNPNLRPERTIDYEIGFQQKLNDRSSIKLSAYYKELRDMIQSRLLTQVAVLGQYTTYDNLDFGTTKGFTFYYDLRRTKNLQMQLSYTLQFADGTGSDANSTRGLAFRGVQRSLYPLNFDERHRFGLNLDYSYGEGKKYNGPTLFGRDIFANAGLNVQMNAVSGRPYTKKLQPTQFGGDFTLGSINGARKPWTFQLDSRLMKNFSIERENGSSLNFQVYLRVSNILNRRNVLNVFTATGVADDDGYLVSANGQSALTAIGNDPTLTEASYVSAYNWRMLNPDFFTQPRRFYLGTVFSF